MIDTKKRSIIKTLTWRVIAVVLLAVTSFLTTGDLRTASLITLIYHSIQLGMFFIHERVWNMVSWGRSSGLFIQMTGMSGAGKTTLARIVRKGCRLKSSMGMNIALTCAVIWGFRKKTETLIYGV